MKTLMLSVSVSIAIAALLIATPIASAQADVLHIQTRTELAANLLNPCNGEMVATEAEQFENITLVTNENGTHFSIVTNIQGTGTGLTTGAKYQLSAVSNGHNAEGSGADNQTLWQDFVFNGQGDVPNFLVQLTEHFTINSNGELVVDFRKLNTKCQ
jgi:hypothetical protein